MPNKYPPDFTRDVVAAVRRDELSEAEGAVDFGAAEKTARSWIRQADVDD